MENEAGTIKIASLMKDGRSPGIILGPRGRWQFTYDAGQVPLVSSKRKLIYQGTFSGPARRSQVAARALVFDPKEIAAFGMECRNLGQLADLNVGPRLFAVTQHDFGGLGGDRPTIIEEDAGDSLATLLVDKVPCTESPVLHEAGTPARQLENMKILYDVFVQLQNAHGAGVFHRDLRCENVCVRRFGPAPAEVRATIIDFDLGAAQASGEPEARASLYRTLFSEVPTRLAGKKVALRPNPLELDMAYLAALQYHLESDGLLLNGDGHSMEVIDDFDLYLGERVSYFGYREGLPPYARRIDTQLDVQSLAEKLGLVPVAEDAFPSTQLLEHAKTFRKPYLDGEDMEACMMCPEARLAEMVDDIVEAKFESYKALRRAQGEVVEYERYDDQPLSLQRSNYAQAEHIPAKVRALGYLIVSEYDPDVFEEVTALTDEQVEALARIEHDRWIDERLSAGWTLGPQRDPEKLTSPYLIPYDDLPERVKEYDRDPARQLIGLVKSTGLTVVRPK